METIVFDKKGDLKEFEVCFLTFFFTPLLMIDKKREKNLSLYACLYALCTSFSFNMSFVFIGIKRLVSRA